jgi:putative oxygen-independent coproporphyrinogen III oxidase
LATPLPLGEPWPKDNRLTPLRDSGSFHAYVHIPFCDVHCGYCDFNTYAAKEIGPVKQADFHLPLIQEIEFSSSVLAGSAIALPALSSIFFGGGTPSLFSIEQISSLLESLSTTHGFLPSADITIEANPDSVDEKYLQQLAGIGVNRVSIGVQSFDKAVLQTLDRTHDADLVPLVVQWAKAAGLRVSVDLIYGAPGESLESWTDTLQRAIALGTEHISAYALIVEPGTKLAAQIRRKEVAEPDEDLTAAKQELAGSMLEAAGLPWYEVANWGVPSIHNKAYWYSKNWWGYGPGAHSHINGNRFWNRKHPLAYQQAMAMGSPAQGIEFIDERTHLEERLMLELRCIDGTDLSLLKELSVNPGKVSAALADGLLILLPNSKIAVSAKGRLLIDGLVLQLLT